MIEFFLAGEGASELGSRSGDPRYHSDESDGVLQALLRAVRPEGWRVVGAIDWQRIRKLRVNAPGKGDARNVRAAHLHAAESGADVLAFVRDRDRDEDRGRDIDAAVAALEGQKPATVGGVAIESIEGWLLAIAGRTHSEAVRHPEKETPALGLPTKRGPDYAAHIEKHGLRLVPKDAASLNKWLECAKQALGEVPAPSSE